MEGDDPKECARCEQVHDPALCSAHSRSGQQCRKPKVPGTTVCRNHGGAAPQTVAKARERLLAAADPAATKLVALVRSKDEQVALRAATAVLDRVGLSRDLRNTPEHQGVPSQVQGELVVTFITNVFARLHIAVTDEVRDVVASELRAMSAAQQQLSRQPAELVAAHG